MAEKDVEKDQKPVYIAYRNEVFTCSLPKNLYMKN